MVLPSRCNQMTSEYSCLWSYCSRSCDRLDPCTSPDMLGHSCSSYHSDPRSRFGHPYSVSSCGMWTIPNQGAHRNLQRRCYNTMSILYYLLSIYSEVENNRYKLFRVYKVIHVFMELRLMHACNLIPVDCFSILPLSILSLQLTIFYFSQNLSLKFDSASTIEVHVYSPPPPIILVYPS